MVYRCYTEKKKGFDGQASNLLHDLREYLGIKNLNSLRIFNRYDVEGIDDNVYKQARILVFSEPQCDNVYDEQLPYFPDGTVLLAVEALPGQFDQRADSCSQCIQMITCGERPLVSYACIYAFEGISQSDMPQIREYLINPVESREATFEKPATLKRMYTTPAPVGMIEGFITADKEGLKTLLTEYGLAMDLDDLQFMQKYFR